MSVQPIRKFKVIKNDCPTKELCRVWFEPVDGEGMFDFEAGQFVMVHELDENGKSVYVRSYSIASAPAESKEMFELGVKSQGKMSGMLFDAKPGDEFGVQGPFGMFTLPSDKNVVFFSGGVGITPFRSIIREALLNSNEKNLTLFYSGRSLDDLIYHKEYSELAKEYSNFRYVPILTRVTPDGWQGESGRLDKNMIEKYLDNFSGTSFLMCGPVLMMDHVKQILDDEDVDIGVKLRAERY